MFQFINCPKCKKKIRAVLKENRWVKWIEIYCSDCEYRKNIHEKEFDYIQPSSPFFKAIYGNDPMELRLRTYREEKRKKENLKQNREDRISFNKTLKPWDKDYIKKTVQERNLE